MQRGDFSRTSNYTGKSPVQKSAMSPVQRNAKNDPFKSHTISGIKNSYSSGSLKRKKEKKSAFEDHLLGYSTNKDSSKYMAVKQISKYASVDNLFDQKINSFKPSLKVKSSKVPAKMSKNSSVDQMVQRSYLDNQIMLAAKNKPSNLKIKKEKIKTKKKKKDLGYISQKFGESNIKLSQEPLSINIVNTNHLHLSDYTLANQKQIHNEAEHSEKKENFHSIIKAFKPNTHDSAKTSKFKQEVKTTKPKSSLLKQSKSNTSNSSRRGESEIRKANGVDPSSNQNMKRSSSQPAIKEASKHAEDLLSTQPKVANYVTVYAFDTLTGMIPGKDDKQNQDRYIIVDNFAGITNNWLFGVCDGHGVNGHFASEHVKKELPTNIEYLDYMLMKQRHEYMKNPSKGQEAEGFFDDEEDDLKSYLICQDRRKKYTVISEGFIKTAIDMQQRDFNIDYSGTTVVTVMLAGNNLVCANVGDSRAVLGSLRDKKETEEEQKDSENQLESVAGPNSTGDKTWMATSLSMDHKPDRADEYERIMQSDGRVDPFREDNGDPVGPARVWLKTQQVPGLAMSRSIGDLVASSVGVIPEPEFFELSLNESDKFLVIASDGVWEFIDNAECVRLVAPFFEANPPDPQGATKLLKELSVEHWKREDEVIDDITVIVVFLKILAKAQEK